jgi:hypothetical protein
MKKKTTTKKRPAASPIPPPPPGWEIVGKDDPRLKKLPCRPLAFAHDANEGWIDSIFNPGERISSTSPLRYALPIATQSATPQPAPASPPMIRLRLPSEKPTREDGDKDGDIITFWDGGIIRFRAWDSPLPKFSTLIAWLPGSLPDGILPREPSQEEKWRAEFEKWWNTATEDSPVGKENAWAGFLAAKKGGAE